MRLTTLMSIVVLAVSSLVSAQSNTCRNSDIRFVRTKIAQPKAFCKWYLSRGRTRSPLARFNAKQMIKLCKCFLPPKERVKARRTSSKPKTGRLYCDKTDLNQLKRQFRDPKNFCKFYTASKHTGFIAPKVVPGLPTDLSIRRACFCYSPKRPITTKKRTTTRTTTEPATIPTSLSSDSAATRTTTTTITSGEPNVISTTTVGSSDEISTTTLILVSSTTTIEPEQITDTSMITTAEPQASTTISTTTDESASSTLSTASSTSSETSGPDQPGEGEEGFYYIQVLSQKPTNAAEDVNGTYVALGSFDTNVDTQTGFESNVANAAYFKLNATSGLMREAAAPNTDYIAIIETQGAAIADFNFWEKQSYPSYPQTTYVAQCTKTASPDDRITCSDGRGFEFKSVIFRETPASIPYLKWAQAGVTLNNQYTDAILYAANLNYGA